jgi:hypothetical protein
MSIQQQATIQLPLLGDGVSTSFTYSFDKLYETISLDSGQITAPGTIPNSVAIDTVGGNIPTGGTASLDGFGNLVLNFPAAWSGQGYINLSLSFNSGTLAGTSQAWTSATAVNTTWTLPLQGSNSVLVPIVIAGTVTGGALQFQASADGATWLTVQGTTASSFQTIAQWNLVSGNTAIQFNVAGYSYFRITLSSVVVGTGSVTFIIQGLDETLLTLISAGVLATYNTTAPAPSNGSGVPAQSDAYGNLFVNNVRRSQVIPETGNIASATPATVCPAQGAGIFTDLGGIVLTSRLGATAAVIFGVLLSDGTKSYRFNLSSESSPTGGGNPPFSVVFDPPLPATTANTAWTIALTSATDSPSVDYIATFIKQQAE